MCYFDTYVYEFGKLGFSYIGLMDKNGYCCCLTKEKEVQGYGLYMLEGICLFVELYSPGFFDETHCCSHTLEFMNEECPLTIKCQNGIIKV